MAKKKVKKLKGYTPSPEAIRARGICNDHGLRIFPVPQNQRGTVYKLHVLGDGYDQLGSLEYDATEDVWIKAVFEQYIKLMKKENYDKKESTTIEREVPIARPPIQRGGGRRKAKKGKPDNGAAGTLEFDFG